MSRRLKRCIVRRVCAAKAAYTAAGIARYSTKAVKIIANIAAAKVIDDAHFQLWLCHSRDGQSVGGGGSSKAATRTVRC